MTTATATATATASAIMSSKQKLSMLREIMTAKRIDAYVVPSEDDHSSEYLAGCDQRRAYISGFDGSAGCAVITQNEAKLWTDGRYWLQAEKQLDEQWTLMKSGLTEVPSWNDWVVKDLPKPSRIGIDPRLLSFSEYKTLAEKLTTPPSQSTPSVLVAVNENLIDIVWEAEKGSAGARPERVASEVFVLEERYSGQSSKDKLKALREQLAKTGAEGLVVSMLDEVAWLFNLRGADIPYNPVFFSYAILTPTDCTLFLRPESTTSAVHDYLVASDVRVEAYDKVWDALKALGSGVSSSTSGEKTADKEDQGKVLIGNRTSWAVVEAIGKDSVKAVKSPVMDAKSIKNETEIEGFRHCHIRDGAALVRYFAWLEEKLQSGAKLTEYQAADQLEAFRKENELFMGLSFDTISSTGPNGAIIHYSPSPTDSDVIDVDAMYLCDSGAQYMDGTTDTTRTLHFGTPTKEEIRAFTRVLQGHISIDTSIYPVGTTGFQLDVFARRALWQDGLDYRHGTGHGVGSFLNVHEGPQGIGMRIAYHDTPLKEGMVISNEPGYYADGKFGIRIENIIVVRKADTPHNFGDKGYLGMEYVTMVPIQTSLVDVSLLSREELAWMNTYHADVKAKVGPVLEKFGDDLAMKWLEKECRRI